METEKRPRQWAAEIMKISTREERVNKLAGVPQHLQDMVRTHVENTFKFRKFQNGEDEKNEQ
jgi:hypothetical protein